jgi:CcmD family protein
VSSAERYVAAAYLVVFVALLAYVFIITLKVSRLERETTELAERLLARATETQSPGKVPVG